VIVRSLDQAEPFTTADGSTIRGDVMVPDEALLEADAEAACADSRFWLPPAAILYRRALVDRIGGWRSNLRIVQDARFLFDAAAQGARFAHVPGVGALYPELSPGKRRNT